MSLQLPDTIEFINGPFDGHIEVLAMEAEKLPENLACFITTNMIQLMNGQEPAHEATVTSVAIYRREHRVGGWIYRFAGVRAPQDAKLATTPRSAFGEGRVDSS